MYGLGGMLAKYGIGLPIQPNPMQQPQQPMQPQMPMQGFPQPGMQPQMPQAPMGLGGFVGPPQNMLAMNASAGGEETKDRGNRPWRVKVYEKPDPTPEETDYQAQQQARQEAYQAYREAYDDYHTSVPEAQARMKAGEITREEYNAIRAEKRARMLELGEAYSAMEDPRQYNEPRPGEGS